jgi:general nucleoside transport system ATP-binding protein
LGDVVLGLRHPGGKKLLWGEDASAWPIRRVRDSGVAFVPEDTLALGCIPAMTLEENFALALGSRYRSGLAVDWRRLRAVIASAFARLGFAMPPLQAPMAALSGGMLQRAVLARELAEEPGLVVALYPTRSLDAASAAAVRQLLRRARDAGGGVLLVSEDLDELFALSDRLLVMYGGTIVGEVLPGQFDASIVGPLMTGASAGVHVE